MLITLAALALLAATPQAAATPAAPAAPAAAAPAAGLGLTGAPNFRDLGGYRTVDGRQVRRGILFRSNKLSALTPADWTRVDALGLRDVFDLRTVEERRAEPTRWPTPPARVYQSPRADLSASLQDLTAPGRTPEQIRAAILRFYVEMPELYRAEYATIFRALAAGETPALIHCTAGKDRTGVASALVLSALGVPRETVLADYALTETLLPPPDFGATARGPVGGRTGSALAALPPETLRLVWRADPEYLAAALDAIDARYGSIQGYLKGPLGLSDVDIAALKRRLLE